MTHIIYPTPAEEAKNVVVFDIDGCLLDSDERIQHLLDGDRASYDSKYHTDKLILPTHMLYVSLLANPYLECWFVTGREASARDYTEKQLDAAIFPFFKPERLLMRPVGVKEHDTTLKPALLASVGVDLSRVLMAFDDRDSVVDMWRSKGIRCYQPQPGPF